MEQFTFLIDGGIGDILLMSAGLTELGLTYEDELRGIVLTHFKGARQLIEPHGIVADYYYYRNQHELNKLYEEIVFPIQNDDHFLGHAKLYGYGHYPEIVWPHKKPTVDVRLPAIAIHPFGSEFANDFLTNTRRVTSKNFGRDCLLTMLTEIRETFGAGYHIYLIGAPGTEKEWLDWVLQYTKVENVHIVCEENIWHAFQIIDECNGVIAADSSMKSFSLIRRRPTVVLLGDHNDEYRDTVFIRPYVEDKILDLVPFSTEPGKEHAKHAVSLLAGRIQNA